ncbi:MAG: hypothetical protein WED33_05615 [Bacteroidia bacterium]
MRLLTIFLLISAFNLNAQQHFAQHYDTLYTIPGLREVKEKSDLSAKVDLKISPDSIHFIIDVTDDEIITGSNSLEGDRIEIWFGSPWLDYADFIVGDYNKQTRIFRNSGEPGDHADLSRFIVNGEYADDKAGMPKAGNLRREHVFAGLVRLVFKADGSGITHADKDKYLAFEKQCGFEVANLAAFASYKSIKTKNGYRLEIALSSACLGFARPLNMNKIRLSADVYDLDSDSNIETGISISKNRFYARAWYMNELNLPFSMNVEIANLPHHIWETLGINQDVVYTNTGWKAYGLYLGALVYAKDFISETGLIELNFYPTDLKYEEFTEPVLWQRLEVSYDDKTFFDQHEVYVVVNKVVHSGKKYRYNTLEKDNFFNRLLAYNDSTYLLAIYDYEATDPLGFGEFGHTADEYIYIQKIGLNDSKPVFNVGQRIEASSQVAIGVNNQLILDDISKVEYVWQKPGRFEMIIKGNKKSGNKRIRFNLNNEGVFEKE